MMINCSAMFVSVFTSISMKIDNFQNAMLGNYSLVGYVIGAILCMILSAFKITLQIYLRIRVQFHHSLRHIYVFPIPKHGSL